MDSFNTEYISSSLPLQGQDGTGYPTTDYLHNSSENTPILETEYNQERRESDQDYLLAGDLQSTRADPVYLDPPGDGMEQVGAADPTLQQPPHVVENSSNRPLKISLQDLDGLELMPLIPGILEG